jgi:soluble lytic murein transglycosylase-like protein
LFLFVVINNFFEISRDMYTLQSPEKPMIQQDVSVKENVPIVIAKEEKQIEIIAKQHNAERKTEPSVSRSSSPDEIINSYVKNICSKYDNVKPELVMSIIYHESRYDPRAKTGNCVGLMQVSSYWHADRATRLGASDFYDPYDNILIGVDYLSELFNTYKDPSLVLMLYNMNHEDAFKLYSEGKTSYYARSVLERAEKIKRGE